jgi:prepilin-type N-terminal cleavage/methylation domain-containing protein
VNRGFSFVEVLCVLLILTVGMLSAIALLRHGVRLSKAAQSASLAFPTARTLLYDTSPSGVEPADWGSAGADSWQGYVNGLWAKRTISDSVVRGNMTYATVKVEVFWSDTGDRSVTLVERIGFYAP